MLRRIALLVVLASFCVGASLVAGCARTLTPAEVEALGKRPFPGRSRGELVKASATALRILGYEVIVANASTGQIKTAPKSLVVTAAGSATSAVAVSNDLAWSLEITPSAGGVTVQAIPRATSGGQSYDGPMNADYMEKAIADLFKEIESNLPGAKSRAMSAAAKPL